jgi:hypothetical protein
MITPQQTDLGRRVIYRPPGAGSRYGVISAIYPRRVFVRFDHQHYSRAVNPAYLEFAERLPKPAKPTLGEQIGTGPGKADDRQCR